MLPAPCWLPCRGLELNGRGWGPARARVDRGLDYALLVALDRVDHRLDQLLADLRRSQAEVWPLGVSRVVVVLFLLAPRVVVVLDRDRIAEVLAGRLHQLRQLDPRELLGELIEDTELARLGGIGRGQFDAGERVAD